MPQATGIVINNTHLLRAAMLFSVLGVIGPGLFQLQPPQWFGDSGSTDHLEMAAQVTAPPDTGSLSVSATAAPDKELVFEPMASPPPAVAPADLLADPLADTLGEVRIAAVPAPGPQPAKTASLLTDSPAENPTGSPDGSKAAQTKAEPEQPAVAARKARPEPPTESVTTARTPVAQETKVASLAAPRMTKVPDIPSASSPPLVVMRDFAKQIPESHATLPVKRQKESFVGITLPLILAANEEISQRRKAIERAVLQGDQATVERWARLYRIETDDKPIAEIERQLLLRADFVPVSLALAQAAIESGWGTSRFALQGNALFGQWAWQKDAGLKPARASNSKAVVRSFPNLFGSVRAYMHNLNTHPRYAAFRARRHLLRGRTQSDLGYQLSNFLDGYAEIGEVYVAKLKTLIRSNDLGQYEAARLR